MSTFGTLFRVSTFGESHGVGVGAIVDGVPPGMKLTEEDIQPQLTRRRPGQSTLTTQRDEADMVTILSGTEAGMTLGTSIGLLVKNKDQRKFDYASTQVAPRPGHADYTYQVKYGVRASSGGGRASARETIGRVAAGAIAEKWLEETYGTKVVAWVSGVQDVDLPEDVAAALEATPPTRAQVDSDGSLSEYSNCFTDPKGGVYDADTGEKSTITPEGEGKPAHTRCPDFATAAKMAARMRALRIAHDSTGGVITCVISNAPIGLGEPCFDKLEADLAKAMMSLPATKAFEIGAGFKACRMKGSEHNDRFVEACANEQGGTKVLRCATNNAGGTLGGISTGHHIVMRIGIKPASSISTAQDTVTFNGEPHSLSTKGRHDPCVLPRAPPLVEGMAALVIADAAMRQRARAGEAKLQVLPENGPAAKKARTE